MKHGRESYYILGEGLITGRLFPLGLLRWIFSLFYRDNPINPSGENYAPPPHECDDDDDVPTPTRRFCRLFDKGHQPDGVGLVDLGQLMETETGDPEDNRDSNIPAGYTYFGQFVDHDITLDRTPLSQTGMVNPEELGNFRTPSLDLDSVYLDGPQANPELYESDGKSFKIGNTSDVEGLGVFPNDLPRQNVQAIIGDGRNDENLIVGQTHLLFLKFHNKLVADNPGMGFDGIRRMAVERYQAIVLTDFLPRVIDEAVLNDVIQNGRQFYTEDKKGCMPVEFSVAAYRMGHSMVRPSYEWNRIFSTGGTRDIATLKDIFEFSGVSGTRGVGDPPFFGLPTLPSNWIADWRRMYNLEEAGGTTHPDMNFARKLDARLAMDLKTLPEFEQMNPQPPAPLLSLATRNLLRGRLVSLPTGQEIANAMGISPLTPDQIVENLALDQTATVTDNGFDTSTPLWYYVLREAMVQANGERLGVVGSRIVAETFVGLIEASPVNILQGNPGLTFSMPELVVSLPDDDVNPLGD